jgi:hypothetical protein
MVPNKITQSSFGKIVRSEQLNTHLKPGNIYLFTEQTNALVDSACEARKALFAESDASQFSQHYDIHVENRDILNEIPELQEAVEKDDNIVLPLVTPNEPYCCKFLIAKTSAIQIDYHLPLLINQAEQIYAESAFDAFINLTVQDPEKSKKIFDEFIAKKHFADEAANDENGGICDGLGETILPSISISLYDYNLDHCDVDSAMPDRDEVYGIAPSRSTQKNSQAHAAKNNQALYDNFVKNCKAYKRLESEGLNSPECRVKRDKIMKDMTVIMKEAFNITSAYEDFAKFLCNYTKLKEEFESTYNKYSIANRSNVKIVVEESKKQYMNDGFLRLYIDVNGQRTQLHFSRKTTFVVYVIYLLDKYHLDTETSWINIADHAELFSTIFKMTYCESGKNEFDNLKKKVLRGQTHPVQMSHCISDIKKTMEETFSELNISSERLPFIISNEGSHLTVRSRNISLPDELKALAMKI